MTSAGRLLLFGRQVLKTPFLIIAKKPRPYTVQGNLPERGVGLSVGHHAQIERTFTVEDVRIYGNLIGDLNPLHQRMDNTVSTTATTTATTIADHQVNALISDEWEAHRQAGLIQLEDDGCTTKVLVHGMFASSIFSSIFATRCPGAVYLSQDLQFKHPIFCNDVVVGRIEVIHVRGARRQPGVIVTCNTEIVCEERICVYGNANVWVPSGTCY